MGSRKLYVYELRDQWEDSPYHRFATDDEELVARLQALAEAKNLKLVQMFTTSSEGCERFLEQL